MKRKDLERANNKSIILALIFFMILTLVANKIFCQESEWNTWANIEVSKKCFKKMNLSLNSEVRFTDQFKVDEYYFEPGLEYKLFKFLEIGGNYRFLINEREKKSTQYYGRIALDASGNYTLKNLTSQLRVRYCNYNEFDSEDDNTSDPYLRYRLKLKYNISSWNLTPYVASELFHQLNTKEINKIRSTLGLEYKINKANKVGLAYILQNYLDEDYKKNIISVEYKISF